MLTILRILAWVVFVTVLLVCVFHITKDVQRREEWRDRCIAQGGYLIRVSNGQYRCLKEVR